MARAFTPFNAIFYLSRATGAAIKTDSSRSIYKVDYIASARALTNLLLCRGSAAYNRSIISRRGSCQNRLEFLMARIKGGNTSARSCTGRARRLLINFTAR